MKYKAAYIEITNVCNLNCSFCIGTRREKRFMPADGFAVIARKVKTVTDYVYLHVLGEPLLHPELDRILEIARKEELKVNITTNGTLLAERKKLLCESPAVRKVAVSLHSFEGNEGAGTLSAYLDGVLDFISAFPGIIELRLWNEGGKNQKNAEITDFFSEKLGVDIAFLPERNRTKVLRNNLFLVSADKFDWPSLSAKETGTRRCHGLSTHFGVLSDGTVVPCCLDSEGTIALGNIFKEEPEKILSSERAANILAGFSRGCPSEDLCRHCGYAARF